MDIGSLIVRSVPYKCGMLIEGTGQQDMGNTWHSLHHLPSFSVKLKLFQKNKVIIKIKKEGKKEGIHREMDLPCGKEMEQSPPIQMWIFCGSCKPSELSEVQGGK